MPKFEGESEGDREGARETCDRAPVFCVTRDTVDLLSSPESGTSSAFAFDRCDVVDFAAIDGVFGTCCKIRCLSYGYGSARRERTSLRSLIVTRSASSGLADRERPDVLDGAFEGAREPVAGSAMFIAAERGDIIDLGRGMAAAFCG
jgi:hypothetical protein